MVGHSFDCYIDCATQAVEAARFVTSSALRTRMADRQHLPLVPIRFVPVDTPPPKVPVDLRVSCPAHLAPVFDARGLDATQNCVKLLFRHAEAEVVDWKLLIGIDEIKGQA